jgi:hypothetical protein
MDGKDTDKIHMKTQDNMDDFDDPQVAFLLPLYVLGKI